MTNENSLASDLDPKNILDAADVIDDAFLNSPQFTDPELTRELDVNVLVKVETLNPLRSFKGRGAEYLLHRLDTRSPLVCASAGNFGQALAYAGSRRGLPVTVFVSENVNPAKQRRMEEFGARVVTVDGDTEDAEVAAREFAANRPEQRWIQDGREPAVAEGAGTIGLELLRHGGIDTIIVPVGDGALINGIGCWVKRRAPEVRVVGVCATGAPAMAESWRRREVVTTPRIDTIAAGIAIRSPVPETLPRLYELVDDMVLVDDEQLIDAMDLAARTLGVLLEPSGAASLAAIAAHDIAGDTIAAILTGADPTGYVASGAVGLERVEHPVE